jgi:hypothetical protein
LIFHEKITRTTLDRPRLRENEEALNHGDEVIIPTSWSLINAAKACAGNFGVNQLVSARTSLLRQKAVGRGDYVVVRLSATGLESWTRPGPIENINGSFGSAPAI